MYPLVCPGRDQVILTKIGDHRVKRGDVLMYRRDTGMLVLHRVWKVKKDGIYMVGDNQSEVEGPLAAEQMKARLVALIRKGKRIEADNPLYLGWSHIWLFLRPLRLPIMKPLARIKKIIRRG